MAFVYCYYNNDHELLWQQDQVPSSYVKIRHIHDKVFYHRPVEFVRPKIRELQSSEGWKERERERGVMKKDESYAQYGKWMFHARLNRF